MDKIKLNFIYGQKQTLALNFDKKTTVREILNTFFDKTNTIRDIKKIMFFYGSNLLTLPTFIDLNIENIVGRGTIKNIIVRDKYNLIGGLILYI